MQLCEALARDGSCARTSSHRFASAPTASATRRARSLWSLESNALTSELSRAQTLRLSCSDPTRLLTVGKVFAESEAGRGGFARWRRSPAPATQPTPPQPPTQPLSTTRR